MQLKHTRNCKPTEKMNWFDNSLNEWSVQTRWRNSLAYFAVAGMMKKICLCGKIGFLPNGPMHIGARVCCTNLCEDINC